ncbi:MAG: hypothetical protein V1659_04105 [Candidatus Woesearchaeota archaeon]
MAKLEATEEFPVAEWEIESENTYNFKKLYAYIHEWWKQLGYTDIDDSSDTYEKYYFERQSADSSSEHVMWWRLKKNPDPNGVFRSIVKFEIQSSRMKKVDVMSHGGKKLSSYNGGAIFRCKASLQVDVDKKWSTHFIIKHFYRWFMAKVYDSKKGMYAKNLYDECYQVNTWIKQYLELTTKSTEPPLWHTPKGV